MSPSSPWGDLSAVSWTQDETLGLAARVPEAIHSMCFVTAYQDFNFAPKCLNPPKTV